MLTLDDCSCYWCGRVVDTERRGGGSQGIHLDSKMPRELGKHTSWAGKIVRKIECDTLGEHVSNILAVSSCGVAWLTHRSLLI